MRREPRQLVIREATHPRPWSETVPQLIGRAVFGGYFVFSGLNHFAHLESTAGYAHSKHVPLAPLAVGTTGAMLIVGGLSLLVGYRPKVGSALLIGFLAGVSPTMHGFWNDQNPDERMADMINFTKNVALAGAAMLAAGSPEPWPISAAHPAR
jgi:uncharacterized membrane protein YphA (DoxX/SURF4 family)